MHAAPFHAKSAQADWLIQHQHRPVSRDMHNPYCVSHGHPYNWGYQAWYPSPDDNASTKTYEMRRCTCKSV
eukprot:1157934-Pelagomonas_calceolata.AAC.7